MAVTITPAKFGVNVKDFGARGNGSTDDTAAFQAAINAARGGKLFIPQPAENYPISDTLTLQPPGADTQVFMDIEMLGENGAIRFVPGTHRTRAPIPGLETEPEWMRNSLLCAPAGSAVIRDVRCWHGGTANRSDHARPMTSVGYHAPWFRAREAPVLPRTRYTTLSARAQTLCRHLVAE